jgi:hypothetical protein
MPPPKLLSNKTKLDMLYRVIGMKVDLVLARLRGSEARIKIEEEKVKVENVKAVIVPGKGGQTTLNFAPKKVLAKTTE